MLYVAGALTCAVLLAITSAAAQSNEPLAPLPQLQTDPRKVKLGYRLFRDARLSRDNSVACVSCHDFARGGADPRAFSIGVGGAVTAVNSPSIFALSANERSGYALFKQHGCAACHQGVNIGGNMFQKLGVMKDYFGVRGPVSPASLGRYNITKREQDRYVFKVPSLRNVALTAPYFHDASAQTLDEAVDVMQEYQVGRTTPQADKRLIIEFLHTLSGQLSR